LSPARRIVVKGVRKREISADDLAYALYLMGKQLVREKREKEAAEKAKREQARRRREGTR
jgi:hypothetical protein